MTGPDNREYKTKKDVVVELIREAILSAEFKPGERLLQEEIARRLNVSPTPVREALRQLEAEGVLDHSPHRGVRVTEVRFEDVREYRAFTEAWLGNVTRHIDGPLVIWTNLLGKEPIRTAAAKLGWAHLRGEYVWAKRTREATASEELLRVVEVALIMTREPPPPQTSADPALPFSVVAGYDDVGASAWTLISLTTVSQSSRDMAREGAELLLRRLEEPGAAWQRRVFEPELIVRGSTGG